MTSLWRLKNHKNGRSMAEDDEFLYRGVRSIVMFSPPSFGSVICFDRDQYKDYYLFCPYAFKPQSRNDTIEVFDIATQNGGYDYTKDEDAIWWHDTKVKASTLQPRIQTEFYSVRLNASVLDKKRTYTVPVVSYSDGVWTRPYYDCFGGKIWMVTYLAPFFNQTNQFLGAVSIDIQLMSIDINQCDPSEAGNDERNDQSKTDNPDDDTKLVEFLGTHRCKRETTKCVHIPTQGFRRGSYTCECKKGFYFPPQPKSKTKHFTGQEVETAFDAMLEGKSKEYETEFECLRCSDGCSECFDDSPCTFSANFPFRISLASINAIVLVMSVGFGVVVCCYTKHKASINSVATCRILNNQLYSVFGRAGFTIRNSTNPDIMYLLQFVYIHTKATTMLLLILVHKLINIRKNQQVNNDVTSVTNAAGQNATDRVYVSNDGEPVAIEQELRMPTRFLTKHLHPAKSPTEDKLEANLGRALRDAHYGTRITGRALRDAHYGTRITGRALRDAHYGTRITGRALRDAHYGTRITGRALRDAHHGTRITGRASRDAH
ncbi:hypothetical protein QZH41_007245 [Actinostola sp. cb2023]|nr:hypothetical protein QZH41_007245 [Actinostola sp. cb2023]